MGPRGRPGKASGNKLTGQIGDWIIFIVLSLVSEDIRGC
jgi:hypothetical protein